ncbi:uncharacterized protein LOC129917995 [Episyrphus balteatus]|uniref:uncharacterized protein LOC129917995 n=1 Tax=Episyrphus balteatus TaxID=286459 RepID=UPI0024864507|nr:uncharacterized protein LOC129917995 [Episyrphus balteatus]
MWYNLLKSTKIQIDSLVENKKSKLKRKFDVLVSKKPNIQKKFHTPLNVDDAVINLSSVQLSTDELDLLNKGLNYGIKPKKQPVKDVIIDIETILKFKQITVKNEIRERTKFCVENRNHHLSNSNHIDENKIVSSLNEKECYVMKSDKGNKIVVMDKNEYDRRCWKLITDSGYDEIKRSPLNKMVTAANEVRKEISNVFGEQFKWKLLISNPDVPRLYCLPKVHKPGDSMRPIVALLSAPCTNISRWLVQEMKQYLPCESLSVKNSIEFAERVKNIELANDEILASFDVSSLFPSIPVPKAIEIFKNNLMKQNIPIEKVNVYVRAAEMCMNTNYFQFRGRFFKINFGTSMGNPLSPLIAETFMADFEMQLKRKGHLPQTWFRYVDDIFTIVKKNKVNDLLSILNTQHNSI